MKQSAPMVKFRSLMHKLTIVFLALLFLGLIGYGLFFVNRFYLKVEPLGGQEVTVTYGDPYVESGAQVKLAGTYLFREGFQVEAKINTSSDVDISKLGSYTVRYDASLWFFQGQGTRSVTVIDTTPPVITLEYLPNHYTTPGESYQEEGFSAGDNWDGDLTAQVTAQEQDGVVIYTVSDSSGNQTQVQREILYRDTIAPVISFQGGEIFHMDAATPFEEPGFTAMDNVDGDITHLVTVEGEVNPYAAGEYVLTYTVQDAEGNAAVAERTVVVDAVIRAETVTPSGKTIYLTFDDGPGVYTKELLRVLDKYGVKATFFVVNTDCADVIQDIVEAGHAVGIHSVAHDYREIYASEEAFFADLLEMQQIIYEKTGIMTYLMRFPGGSSNTVSRFNEGIMTRLTRAVEDAGFYYFDWNVDSDDAGKAKKAETVFENVKDGVRSRRVSIVLQHDIKDYSVEAVEDIICWGLENGYTFRALDETSPGAHHGVNN